MTATETRSRQAATDLELLVDGFGMEGVVSMLAVICREKAEHIASNWQDAALARAWERNALAMQSTAGRVTA